MTTAAIPPDLARFVADMDGDDAVRGIILTGSATRDMRTPRSDIDAYLVRDETADPVDLGSPSIDVTVTTLTELRSIPGPPVDDERWWSRYSFADARMLVDRTGGELSQLAVAWATLTDDEVSRCLDAYLDGYLNFVCRSLKADLNGRDFERRADAVESISWMLWTVFALAGRIRPYNGYLRHELAVRPLPGPLGEIDLIRELERIMDSGDPVAQRRITRVVETAARGRGKGHVIDAWGDDLTLLRGG